MEKLRVLTFQTVNYSADFVVFALAYALGFVTWWYTAVGSFKLVHLQHIDVNPIIMLYLIFYGCNFFYLAYYQAYHSSRMRPFPATVAIYIKSMSMALLLAVLVAFLFPFLNPSRTLVISATAYAFLLLVFKEQLIRMVLRSFRRRGHFHRLAVIVGDDHKLIEEIGAECDRDYILGMSVIGLIEPRDGAFAEPSDNDTVYPVLGSYRNLPRILDDSGADTVIFFAHDLDNDLLDGLMWVCEERGLEVWVKLDFMDRVIYSATIDSLRGIHFINFRGETQNAAALFVKYSLDRLLAGLGLLILSPLLLIVSLLIKLSSPGRVIFAQERAGLNGRSFNCYKFRSMVNNAEDLKDDLRDHNEVAGPAFKVSNDPRVTPLGKLLRKTSIDELPQLMNVLKGDMSLVGPRPLPVDEVRMFEAWHRRRLRMKPGVTGMWQVAGRSNVSDFNNWARMDLDYIDRWSLALDAAILLRTVPAVLFCRGAK